MGSLAYNFKDSASFTMSTQSIFVSKFPVTILDTMWHRTEVEQKNYQEEESKKLARSWESCHWERFVDPSLVRLWKKVGWVRRYHILLVPWIQFFGGAPPWLEKGFWPAFWSGLPVISAFYCYFSQCSTFRGTHTNIPKYDYLITNLLWLILGQYLLLNHD